MNRTILILLIFALFLVSCKKAEENEEIVEEIISVKAEKPTVGYIENTVKYLGDIEAFNEVHVYSLLPQKITSIQADVNDFVNKGDVLATVKNVEVKQGFLQAEAGLASAQAQLENVKTEWNRTKKLYKEKAISKSQYDAVKAQKEAAEAGVKQAKAFLGSTNEQLKNATIISPITGIISQRNFDFGDQTSIQIPAFTVIDMNRVKIKVDLVEQEIHGIKEGNKAYIEVVGIPEKIFKGKVNKVYPTVDPLTRTVKAELIVDNPDYELRPGMYAKVRLVTQSAADVLLLPNHAIIEKTFRQWLGGEVSNAKIIISKYCFIVKDGVALKVDLKTGIENSKNSQILEGISSNDDVIIIGQHNISDNQKVQIVD